jgi:hypothetical protein
MEIDVYLQNLWHISSKLKSKGKVIPIQAVEALRVARG